MKEVEAVRDSSRDMMVALKERWHLLLAPEDHIIMFLLQTGSSWPGVPYLGSRLHSLLLAPHPGPEHPDRGPT